MTETTGLFLAAAALGSGIGFQGSVSPGPLQTLLISETLSNGVRSSWRAAFAPVMSDPIALTLALSLVMIAPDWAIALIAFGGAAMLSWLAWGELKATAEDFELHRKPRRSLFQIWCVNITNPNLWIYSFTVNSLIIRNFWEKGGAVLAGFYLLVFFVTIVSCNLATVLAVGALKQVFNPKALVVINRILGCALFCLALRFVYLGLVKLDILKEASYATISFLTSSFEMLI